MVKIALGCIAILVLFGAFVIALTFLRKSVPYVLRGDIQQLIASQVNEDSRLASEICGVKVERLIGPQGAADFQRGKGDWPWAKVALLSWRPFFPAKGTLTARVTGVGVDRADLKPLSGPCVATLTFSYECEWRDNGRSYTLHSVLTGAPKVERGI